MADMKKLCIAMSELVAKVEEGSNTAKAVLEILLDFSNLKENMESLAFGIGKLEITLNGTCLIFKLSELCLQLDVQFIIGRSLSYRSVAVAYID